MTRVLVLGAGFAGLWAAAGAARKLDETGRVERDVEILVVDRNPYHNIRVRNYEIELREVAIPLGEVLDPIGVKHVTAEVKTIDIAQKQVRIATRGCEEALAYDRIVVALGSELRRPSFARLSTNCFDVDTYTAAMQLNEHLAALSRRANTPGHSTVVVVGAGFTGIEVATEMPAMLRRALGTEDYRVILVDPNPVVGATIGEHARPVILEALSALRIETRLAADVAGMDSTSIILGSGEVIPTQTVVWCAGMRASPLLAALPGMHDRLGRIAVDQFMRAKDLTNVFAAGDAASSLVDDVHSTVMSCQFARPMGRFAGHNVIADLLGKPMLSLRIDWYVTVLDLGAWGALYTGGWDRRVISAGQEAKGVKQTINQKRIYPPRTGRSEDIFASAAPTVQRPPQYPGTST
jgi:NADH:ubiquinone reductase (H+-translocating)